MNLPNENAKITMCDLKWQFFYENTLVLSLSTRYPEVELSGAWQAQERINSRILMQTAGLYRYASGILYRQAVREYHDSQIHDFPFRPYDAVMKYETTYNQNCHLSIFRDRYQYTGGAHGSTIRASDTWSLKTGRRVPLARFFKFGENYRRIILDEILRQADKNMEENSNIYFEDYRQLIRKHFNTASYYLTPDGIAIYYQQYEIAPYSSGIVTFIVPYGMAPVCKKL